MAGTESLQTRVSQELEDLIVRIGIQEGWSKTQTLYAMMNLALENPDFEKRDFGNNQNVANCSLELSEEEYAGSLDYRLAHKLNKKAAFLRDALERGVSVYTSDQQA